MADSISREAAEKLKQSEKIELFPELQGERYIDRITFLADIENRYCVNCEKRKGKKNGKIKTLYEIGEAPCKACGVMDMMEDVDAYPATDVRPVVRGRWNKQSVSFDLCGIEYFRCSCCGWEYQTQHNFCPNCGADMRRTDSSLRSE